LRVFLAIRNLMLGMPKSCLAIYKKKLCENFLKIFMFVVVSDIKIKPEAVDDFKKIVSQN